jgi:hypothetical protein
VTAEATGPLGAMRALSQNLSGNEADLRFQCHRCTKVRKLTQIVLWSSLLGLLAIVLILERLGFLAR